MKIYIHAKFFLIRNYTNKEWGSFAHKYERKKLSQIKVGKQVIIKSFEKDEIYLKLMEMGCVPGELVTVDQIAPLKDPISITVAGYRLSLRLDEADQILVEEI